MTTIAWDGKTIATDSRWTRGEGIISSDADAKMIRRAGYRFFVTGLFADAEPLIDAFLSGRDTCSEKLSVTVYAEKGGHVMRVGADKGAIWKESAKVPDAAGSGWGHAITAMDMGADARTAVKMAIKRDSYSGGKIRTYRVKK